MTITTSSRFAPSAIALAFAALLAACASNPAPGSRSVTIERTTYGIAHITAPDYEGIAYGVAYAHAQDNVCQTAEHLLTVRGERAQFLGAQATGELGLGRLPNTQIDLFVRAHMDDAALARAAAANNEDVKACCAATWPATTATCRMRARTACPKPAATSPGYGRCRWPTCRAPPRCR